MGGTIQELQKIIPIEEALREIHPEWDGKHESLVLCPFDHGGKLDRNSSLSINLTKDVWQCFGCRRTGSSLVGYLADRLEPDNFKKGLGVLRQRYLIPTGLQKDVGDYCEQLQRRPKVIERITRERGWLPTTIAALKIGWDPKEKRVTIPIFDTQGICIDIRRHDSIRAAPAIQGKRVSVLAQPGSTSGSIFPSSHRINPFDIREEELWCVEGEPDAISAWQEGLNAITITGGVGAWNADKIQELLNNFEGKSVIICFDNDSAGQQGVESLAKRLLSVRIYSLKSITVPEGNDIGDFFCKHHGTAAQLRQRAQEATYLIPPKRAPSITLPLGRTSEAQFIGALVEVAVLINGKHHTAHVVPRRIEFSCYGAKCSRCPCERGRGEYYVDLAIPSALIWLQTMNFAKTLKEEMGLSKECKMRIKVAEWQNMEQINLTPALSTSRHRDKEEWCSREAYYIGHGIEANQSYKMECIPASNPRTKESILIVQKADNTNDSIGSFRLTQDEVVYLQAIFCDRVTDTIREVCKVYGRNYTKIYRRWTLHAAVDLTFHSILQFDFAGVVLPKGSIELLLLGDTRCGKGQVAEGISRALDLGEVISGENTSFMGLAGGLSKGPSDNFELVWGAIPLSHGRLVIIDEFASLGPDILGKLSRIRSEGIAELAKGGITSKTRANTRLIWIANPRGGRAVSDFASGVEAIQNLVKAQEDIARFDLAVVVQRGEVSVAHINQANINAVKSKYTRKVLQKVVRWVWSLAPEQINFEATATSYILEQAIILSNIYSPSIPLIQGENVRFKIAKLAASVAGRCFSTKDGHSLEVRLEHAEFAVAFLRHCYNSPAMGYEAYSKLERQTDKLRNKKILDTWLDQFEDGMRRTLIDGMLSMHIFRVPDLQDWTEQDIIMAKRSASILVQAHAVKMITGKGYQKRPSFIDYLKNYTKKEKSCNTQET